MTKLEEALQRIRGYERRAEGWRIRYRLGSVVASVAKFVKKVAWTVEKWGMEMRLRALSRETDRLKVIIDKVNAALEEVEAK